MMKPRSILVLVVLLAGGAATPMARAEGGSIHNHLTLDILPVAFSPNNPAGGALALSYDRYHDWLKSSYEISIETGTPYGSDNRRFDVMPELGFFTEINAAFSVGARVGVVVNNPGNPWASARSVSSFRRSTRTKKSSFPSSLKKSIWASGVRASGMAA